MVGLALFAGTIWLTAAQDAAESVYVRALNPDEAEARKVGAPCDWTCGTRTLPCPRPGSMKDWCANGTTERACNARTRLGGCYECSIGANWTICDKKPSAGCELHGAKGQVCGFIKHSSCNWTGTKCVCPGLPANYSTDPCKDNNCKQL